MFNLSQEVNAWCDKVVAHDIWDAEKVDELKDHLYCLIEEQVAAGKTEQAAFIDATSAMGYPAGDSDNTSAHARIVQGVCRILQKVEGKAATESPLLISHAVIWACVMLAAAIILRGQDAGEKMFFILLMGWLASYFALGGNQRSAKQEWACIKRKFRRAA